MRKKSSKVKSFTHKLSIGNNSKQPLRSSWQGGGDKTRQVVIDMRQCVHTTSRNVKNVGDTTVNKHVHTYVYVCVYMCSCVWVCWILFALRIIKIFPPLRAEAAHTGSTKSTLIFNGSVRFEFCFCFWLFSRILERNACGFFYEQSQIVVDGRAAAYL